MPPYGPSDDACLKAHELWAVDGLTDRQIATAMAGAPYFCGSHTTARRWRLRGVELALDESIDMGRRRQRQRAAARVDGAYREFMAEWRAGRLTAERLAAWKARGEFESIFARLYGTAWRPKRQQIQITGGRDLDPQMLAQLEALFPDEKDQ